MYNFRYTTHPLGTVTVQVNKNVADNVYCICSRVLIDCHLKSRKRKKGLIVDDYVQENDASVKESDYSNGDIDYSAVRNSSIDEDDFNLQEDQFVHQEGEFVVTQKENRITDKDDTINFANESIHATVGGLESPRAENVKQLTTENSHSCFCCGLFCCFGNMVRFLRKKLSKRRKYKGLQKQNTKTDQVEKGTSESCCPSTTANVCNGSVNAVNVDKQLPIYVSADVEDVTTNNSATSLPSGCCNDPVKDGLRHMGFFFDASRSNQKTLYKRVFLDYDEEKVERWNKNLTLLPNSSVYQAYAADDDDNNHFYPFPRISKKRNQTCENYSQNTDLPLSDNTEHISNTDSSHNNLTKWTVTVSKKNQKIEQKNKFSKKRKIAEFPDEAYPVELRGSNLKHYYSSRYRLFSKFDEGIKLDAESWYSVTPEKISKHIADRCCCDVIIDGFCGAGGNTIQFAFTCERVIAIDIDPVKIELAKHNAKIYGVEDRIEFIVGDFFKVAPRLQADVVFLSPPWGGPNYKLQSSFPLADIAPCGGKRAFKTAQKISSHVALYLPRNINVDDILNLLKPGEVVEVEQQISFKKLVAVTAYFGELTYEEEDLGANWTQHKRNY